MPTWIEAGIKQGTSLIAVLSTDGKQQQTGLVGLYKDNPRRVTATPTAERLLQAFVPLTLTQVQMAGQTIRHVTPLSPLQEQILGLLGLPADLYAALAHRIPQTAFPLRE